MSQLASGTRIGPYEIVSQIGAGGMGEVYRATDSRLKRQVALKVLPAALTADPDRLARFQREAEVLASLNHPNIAALYGLEESGGIKALVMELVEGPTIADRLQQGAIPMDEALPIARQIAEALEAAHEQQIIHRDLKPANIKLRPDGTVKVLDFGLAKAMAQDLKASRPQDLANSPTITSPAQMTGAGMILGTAAYMSPEQAAGKAIDRRSDLWAFGVVLFEMLTGQRLFDGESVSHVIAAVLKDDPEWSAVPADTPPIVRALLQRCLQKDRRKRLSDAGMARLEIDDAMSAPAAPVTTPVVVAPASSRWAYLIGGALAGAVLVGGLIASWLRPAAPVTSHITTFAIDLAAEQVFTRMGRHALALSPDGTQLVFVAEQQLFIRPLNELNAKPIAGTIKADPSEPTFSPDGQWIAFWSGGQLKKISVTGGTPVRLADIENPYGMSWTGDRIVYAQEAPPTISAVATNGGAPEVLITFDRAKNELAQSPQLVAGGRAVLFTLRTGDGSWNDAEIVVQDVASGRRTTLVRGGTDARALGSGYLLYSREDALFAAPFNADQPEQVGTGLPVRQNILQSVGGFTGAAQFAMSASGNLAFIPDDLPDGDRILEWMDRHGKFDLVDLPPRRYWPGGPGIAASPDGKHVAMRLLGNTRSLSDIWVWDVARGAVTRLTLTGVATDPVWSRDGAGVCYAGHAEMFCQSFDGASPPRSLLKKEGLSTVTDIAPDGTALLNVSGVGGFDIWSAPNTPQREAVPLVATAANESGAKVSPDGRWLAYQSSESGADEVYVRTFPALGGGKWQVSAGGIAPRWSRDGRELYYLATRTGGVATSLTLMAVPIGGGAGFQSGAAVPIAPFANYFSSYDVMPDGRFLFTKPVADLVSGTPRQRVVVVQNWITELRAKMSASASHP